MEISPNTIKAQMMRLKPLLSASSVETQRRGQNMIGDIMKFKYRKSVIVKNHNFDNFSASWVLPKKELRSGVILYLHGGGFTSGDLKYATGVASTLSVLCKVRVFAPAYRLAPEHPFPAALDDAVESYKYLIKKGYSPSKITLCGESAGGALCYSLCIKLKELKIELPGGIIAFSPWVNLENTGASYAENAEADPTMSKEMLDFYSKNYTDDFKNPLVSPIYGDLSSLPPSIIFAADNEILKSDSEVLDSLLKKSGCASKLYTKSDRWHAYVLFALSKDTDDFTIINQFLNKVMSDENRLRWMRLDNAAKIYPAARSNTWSNVFRLSVSLKEEIDVEVLKSALDITVRRFPSICARLRRGVFWYYLEQTPLAPEIKDEASFPLTRMSKKEAGSCALRVIVYKNRIATEFFHALTDGTGGMIFLKTLCAEYLSQKYGIVIPAENGVLGRLDEPSESELEDSFQKYAGNIQASRKEQNSFHIKGTPEPDGYINLVCLKLSSSQALEAAHKYGVSLTVFLCSALMRAIQKLEADKHPNIKKRKPVKVLVPVNLRNIFPSKSVRNFALYTTPEIEPRHGEYTFEEICKIVSSWLASDVTAKKMAAKIASNIYAERNLVVRLMPLFIKNFVMKAVYNAVGEKKSCLTLSNLGNVKLPDVMKPYIERFDFILGVQATISNNCGVVSFGDTLCINFIRDITESDLELQFYKELRDLGLDVSVESNQKL